MLRIKGKQCGQERRLTAWSTGAGTAAELYRTEKGTQPHKAEAAQLNRAEVAALHKAEMRAEPHKADMRTGTRRADRGKNRKCGSP